MREIQPDRSFYLNPSCSRAVRYPARFDRGGFRFACSDAAQRTASGSLVPERRAPTALPFRKHCEAFIFLPAPNPVCISLCRPFFPLYRNLNFQITYYLESLFCWSRGSLDLGETIRIREAQSKPWLLSWKCRNSNNTQLKA